MSCGKFAEKIFFRENCQGCIYCDLIYLYYTFLDVPFSINRYLLLKQLQILLVSWLQCFRHDAYQGENFNWEGNRD